MCKCDFWDPSELGNHCADCPDRLRAVTKPETLREQVARILGLNPRGPLGRRILDRVRI